MFCLTMNLESDSDSLISLIEDWVRGGGASVIVTGILMTVDPHCSVAISSLSEQCSPTIPSVTTTPSPSEPDTNTCMCSNNTPSMVAGVVVVIVVVAVVIAVIVISVTLVWKKGRAPTKIHEK